MAQGPEFRPSASEQRLQGPRRTKSKSESAPNKRFARSKGAEKEGPAQKVVEIEVFSEFDHSSNMLCCGKPTIQKQIDYTISVNDELLRIPKVWASVCQSCNQPFFAPDVGTAISNGIFELQNPLETKIANLLAE